MKHSIFLAAALVFLSLGTSLFSQEAPQTRREILLASQKLLLEEHLFSPEEILRLVNLRQEAELQGEGEMAVDLGVLIFAARRTAETQTFQAGAEEIMRVEWEKEVRRRDRESLKNFMNGSAGALAVLGGASLAAGFGFHQLSSQAFARYAGSPVNSDQAFQARADYRNFENYSYLFMAGSAVLFTLSTRLMFLQN